MSRPLPTPPATLTRPERFLFLKIVDANAHLKTGDTLLLTAFVQAAIKFERLGKTDNVGAWEKTGRMMLALARGLRLLPTTAARTLTRMREDHRPSMAAQYLAEHPEDDDDDSISLAH
ncbi:hypothetical protein Q2941_37555 [Bradyrhizobium sp. UFLA05-153]